MSGLSDAELEEIYDLIADAIDRAGPRKESLFLAKLCLALAHDAKDAGAVRRAIRIAMEETEPTPAQDPASG